MAHEKRERSALVRHANGPWARGGIIGFAAMLVVFGLAALLSGTAAGGMWPEIGGVLSAAVLFGSGPGILVGMFVDAAARRRTRIARPQVTVEELQYKIQHVKDRLQRPDDVWERMLLQCVKSVQAAGEAVALAPKSSAATEWLSTLYDRMEQELDNADTLAQLARAAFPDEHGMASAAARAHPLHERLRQAVADFEQSKQSVVDIVARLVRTPDLAGVRSELKMLEIQLPVLAEPDPG